jgi:hypothetical protein
MTTDKRDWPATDRRTPADECQSCLEHTDDPPGLPAADVLADAVTVLRELADDATPGHRRYDGDRAVVGPKLVASIYTKGDRALWAAFGPDEARLLARLLEKLPASWPPGYPASADEWEDLEPVDYAALDLAYALTGHTRPGEEIR